MISSMHWSSYTASLELKAFYTKKIPQKAGPVCTENCDLLMPDVGEIVGE